MSIISLDNRCGSGGYIIHNLAGKTEFMNAKNCLVKLSLAALISFASLIRDGQVLLCNQLFCAYKHSSVISSFQKTTDDI